MKRALLVACLFASACASTQDRWHKLFEKEEADLRDAAVAVQRELDREEANAREEERLAAAEALKGTAATPPTRPEDVRAHESDAVAAMKEALAAARAGDFDLAKRRSERAAELRPGFVDPLMMLAALAEQRHDFEEARRRYHEVLQWDPTDVAAGNALGSTYLAQGRFDQAREWFQKTIDSDPGFEAAAYNLGSLAEQARDLEAAAGWFDVSATLDPSDPRAHVHVAAIRLAQGRAREALTAADAALARWPQSRDAQMIRARALEALGRQ